MSTKQKSSRHNSSKSIRSVDIQGPMSSRPSITSSITSIAPPRVVINPRNACNPNDMDIEITVANGSAWISRVSNNLAVKDSDGLVSEDAVKSSYTLQGSSNVPFELNLVIPKNTA